MNQILIIDEAPQPVSMEAWRRLKDHVTPANIIIHSTEGENEMFMSRHIIAAALAAGLINGHQTVNIGGVNHVLPVSSGRILSTFEHRGKGKGRTSHSPSGCAAAKRAKAKRRNVSKHPRSAHKNSRSGRSYGRVA